MPRIKKSGLVVCQGVTDCERCRDCDHSEPHEYNQEDMGLCYGECSRLDQKVDCVPVETIKTLPKFS